MSKSVGNLITIKEALAKYSSDAIRIFILSSHYRSPLTYSEEALEAAERGEDRLAEVIRRDDPTGGEGKALDAEPYRQRFIEAMDDDFNTPKALATLFDLARAINQAGDSGFSFLEAKSVLEELARNVLGYRRRDVVVKVPTARVGARALAPTVYISVQPTPEAEVRVNRLVEERSRCREAKQWQRADEIRAKLAELGVVLEDTPQGTKIIWKRELVVELLDNLLTELSITL
jgi:cysteinyl-tRNA synthetase